MSADSRLLEASLQSLLIYYLVAQDATLFTKAYEILDRNSRIGMRLSRVVDEDRVQILIVFLKNLLDRCEVACELLLYLTEL